MGKRKLSERQQLQQRSNREMSVYKRDDMIQKSRHQLSVREQKCVLFAISKIKPEDKAFQEYVFELKDFYAMCGLDSESYTELKAMLLALKSKSWWMEIDDQGTESAVSWFSTVRTNKRSGKVTVEFHKDMMPFLLQLAAQDTFYTGYNLQYVLPMSSQYSPRLYELLKSYQKNNREWFFTIDELKRVMDCQGYDRWPDFRRRALEPAVAEINQYTDINIAWDVQKEGKKVARVIFYMADKSDSALLDAQKAIQDKLDGQVSFDELQDELRKAESSVKAEFFKNNPPRRKKTPSEDA